MERLNPFARPGRPPEDAGRPDQSQRSAFPGAVPASRRNGSASVEAPEAAVSAPSAPAPSVATVPSPSSVVAADAPPATPSAPAASGHGGAPAPSNASTPAEEPAAPTEEPAAPTEEPAAPAPAAEPDAPADAAPTASDAYPTEGRPGPDDPRLHAAIRELRSAIDVVGVMIATSDGLALAYDLPTDDALRIAAMAATGLGLGRRLVDSFGHESFQEQVTRGSDGYFVVYSAGRDAVLAIIAPATCNLGMLHHQSRRIAARLGDLLAGPQA